MKKYNLNNTHSAARQRLSLIIVMLLTSLLGACQLTDSNTAKDINKHVNTTTNYSQYYLWLKSLNKEQVIAEEAKQKALMNQPNSDKTLNQGKLILIYSLPTSPLHQPYKAKRLLNEHLLVSNLMTKDNFAFTALLRDQLNAQLNLLSKQEKSKKYFSKQQEIDGKTIEELKQQLDRVNNQLMLLKQIDKNINERG